jgi:2-oxoisovalerate dehydrogenase E1 component
VQQIKGKVRTAMQGGKPVPKMKMYNVRDGIFEAMLYRFAIDPTMAAFGEENRDWGGAFAVYRGLTEALPYHRCSTRRFQKRPLSARPWDTRSKAAGWWRN